MNVLVLVVHKICVQANYCLTIVLLLSLAADPEGRPGMSDVYLTNYLVCSWNIAWSELLPLKCVPLPLPQAAYAGVIDKLCACGSSTERRC